jgi:multiple sugar transport system permease protein
MLVTSLLPASDLLRLDPDVAFSKMNLSTYGQLLTDPSFLLPLRNSALVASVTALSSVILGSLAAYGIARFRFPGRRAVMIMMLGGQMVPAVVLVIPLFLILRDVGLLDTVEGLMVTYVGFIMPIVVWMLVGFFEGVPVSLERAARIDGCSRIGVLVRVIAPISGTALVAAVIFAFISAWSDLFIALVLTAGNSITLPVEVANFEGLFVMQYRSAAAAGIITLVPVLLLAAVFQKWIVAGLTEGVVKG